MNTNKIKSALFDHKTTLLFVALCLGGIWAADQPLSFVLNELVTRFGRNTFLVLALLIPIQAGMGLNFAVIIGAMATQIAVFLVVLWDVQGYLGFFLCVVLAVPFAILFGYLVGALFNKMKGSEMIGGIILQYFSEGLYQFLFLFVLGGVITINNRKLMISSGVGVKNTIDLQGGIRYALDDLLRVSILDLTTVAAAGIAVFVVYRLARYHRKNLKSGVHLILIAAAAGVLYGLTYVPEVERLLAGARVPIITFGLIGLLCLFNTSFMKTRLGQNMRAVGQSMHIAKASGINVNRTRITAIVMSTVIASWGQLILLQNIGTFQTYGAHTQVGLFAIAALLVGGASVHKASNGQAVLGVILFHTLFIVSPIAGKNLFNSAQLGEYFRVFVSYGVIAVSLALHAWKTYKKTDFGKEQEALPEPSRP